MIESVKSDTRTALYKSRIRNLNDQLRHDIVEEGHSGKVTLSPAVTELASDRLGLARLIREVRSFSKFDKANDPHNEHDYGRVTLEGVDYLWKIDYYDLDLEFRSEDPSDPTITIRVLALMRADEY